MRSGPPRLGPARPGSCSCSAPWPLCGEGRGLSGPAGEGRQALPLGLGTWAQGLSLQECETQEMGWAQKTRQVFTFFGGDIIDTYVMSFRSTV